MSFNKFLQISITILSCSLIPLWAQGAVLYLESASGEYHLDDVFIVEVRLNTEGESINTAEVNLTFPQEILEVKDFSKGNSILTLWVKEPSFSNKTGVISFIGGIPGGCLEENGLLGKVIFRVKEKGEAEIEFQKASRVLLNDGFGTEAKLEAKGAVFNVLAEKLELSENEWLREIRKDTVSPEPFEIEISQDPNIFEGKYFITFSTTDKQTGIDYYQVSEMTKNGLEVWQTGRSPHLLEDQTLKSIIRVKAVDKAGNEIIAEYIPPQNPFPYWIIILILAGVGIIWLIIKKCLYVKATKKYN